MTLADGFGRLAPGFLEDRRVLCETAEDGGVHAHGDQPRDLALVHLLMVLCAGKLRWSQTTSEALARRLEAGDGASLAAGSGDDRVVRWVDWILTRAVDRQASDIHLEPREDRVLVRLRIDGLLTVLREFEPCYREELTSRLKVLADLDVAEKRRPQDGKLRRQTGDDAIDFRLSCIPTDKGEKIVIRVLDRRAGGLRIAELGLPPAAESRVRDAIANPHGMVLVTGPTGSGKTTTLYAALREIAGDHLNITTIEDPIEYQIEGITQTQVRPEIGFGFGAALRSFLRQDPNVILVGEIRDEETAELAVRAALTGHLVLSTLHANHAVASVPRLLDMGLPPFLLANALALVIAQRLVRRLCPACCQPHPDIATVLSRFRLTLPASATPRRPVGCDSCRGLGFAGRLGVFEAFRLNAPIREAVQDRQPVEALAALDADYRPMIEHGLARVAAGQTSLEELCREVLLG